MKLTSPFKLGWLPTRGDIAPDWYGVDTSGARVGKDLFAGHTVLFCFVPAAPDAALPMLKGLRARYARIVEKGAVLCCVLLEQPVGESFPYPTIIDPNQQVTNAFCRHRNEVKASPRAVLQDGDGRILATVPISLSAEGAEAALDLVIKHEPFTESLSLHAPVLHVPNVLGPKQCEQLIRAFREGEQRQGTTINIRDGKPVIVVNAKHKLRTDYTLRGDLKENMWSILVARIKPAIRRAFHFDIAHYEYMQIGRYGAEHKGFFRAHRDNFSTVSRHRRYAMSLNLNDGYEGGYLRFLEYGKRQYRPKSGDAVIFSTALLHEALPVTKGERFVLVSFFWGEAEVPLFEESKRIKAMGKTVVANRRIMSPAPARRPTPATDTDKHLRQDARLFREIAGDLKAFGPEAARVPNLVQRLSALNADLMHLHRDLHAVRARFVDNQTRKLKLGSELKVHLGCGRYRLKGWVNIDATGGDVRAVLLGGPRCRILRTTLITRIQSQSCVRTSLYKNRGRNGCRTTSRLGRWPSRLGRRGSCPCCGASSRRMSRKTAARGTVSFPRTGRSASSPREPSASTTGSAGSPGRADQVANSRAGSKVEAPSPEDRSESPSRARKTSRSRCRRMGRPPQPSEYARA
jgi:predicted 2-oxoglutarate/Fe(II)-dependent dioxygenase YbiX